MEALKMRSIVAGHQKLTATNREHHQCWCSYSYTRSCPRTQHRPFYSCLVFEANWKVKKLSKWMLHELTAKKKKKKKIHCFEVLCCLNLSSNNETFFDWIVVCNKKGNLYDKEQWPPMSLDWEETPKHFPKANLQQKVSHGHCLLSESCWNHYFRDVFSANWWDAPKTKCLQPALTNRMSPILLCNNTQPHSAQPMLQKLNELGYEVLPHLPYSPDLLPTDYHFFKHPDFFGRENSSTNSRMEKMFFKSSLNPEVQNSFATGIKPSNWQKCVDCNGSYFD